MTAEEKEQRKAAKRLESQLAQESKDEANKVKLLILGAGESGKSTVFKQMKLIYGQKYTSSEKKTFIPTIHINVFSAIQTLSEQAEIMGLDGEIQDKENYNYLRGLDDFTVIDIFHGNKIKALWDDPVIQKVWERRSEFQLVDSVLYYFQDLDRIMQPNFLPSDEDILHSRVRTTGIITERYRIDGNIFEMYDVGGQRNERKKWIHCFEGVTAIIFVAALSEFDLGLFEDQETNRMVSLP